jgi:hypothetical protein
LLLLLILTGLFVVWRRHSSLEKDAAFASTQGSAYSSNKIRRALHQNAPKQTATLEPQPGDPKYPEYYVQQSRLDRQFDWKRPINFYGRVIDENETPVAGAKARFVWNDLSIEGTSTAQTISDADGLFSLLDRKGKGLTVTVTKDGYYTFHDSDRPSFEYANPYDALFVPDSNNPVVFHLRKKGTGEPLLTFSKNFAIPRDGTPVGIELSEGKKVSLERADLVVRCWTQDREKDSSNRYDWKLEIQVPKGGLLESTNEFPFLAPVDGYKERDEIEMPKTLEGAWKRTFERKYFVKTRKGSYGRIQFRMIAHGDHFCIIDSALNPPGSRNLEYDPVVRPKQTQFE